MFKKRDDLLREVKRTVDSCITMSVVSPQTETWVQEFCHTYKVQTADALFAKAQLMDYFVLAAFYDALCNLQSSIKDKALEILSAMGVMQVWPNAFEGKETVCYNWQQEDLNGISKYRHDQEAQGAIKGVVKLLEEEDFVLRPMFHYPPVPKLAQMQFSDGLVEVVVDPKSSSREIEEIIAYTKWVLYDIKDTEGVDFVQFTHRNQVPGWGSNGGGHFEKVSKSIYEKYNLNYEPGIIVIATEQVDPAYMRLTQADYLRIEHEQSLAPMN